MQGKPNIKVPFTFITLRRNFGLKDTADNKLVWEEEALGSTLFSLDHSDVMPILDGDYMDRSVARKHTDTARCVPFLAKLCSRISFTGHLLMASNLEVGTLLRERE